MTARTITVTLTEAQYRALADAVITAEGEDEVRDPWTAYDRGKAQARSNAWDKINRAWHNR